MYSYKGRLTAVRSRGHNMLGRGRRGRLRRFLRGSYRPRKRR